MKRLLPVLIIITLLIFVAYRWWSYQFAPVSSETSSKVFVVEKGAGVSQIAQKLKEENLIKSELAFKIYIRQNNLTNKIQAGTFKLAPSMDVAKIANSLTENPLDNWITLIEGWRVEEMAEEINSKFKIKNSKFLEVAKEGYMFPDSYLFPKDVTVEQIAKAMRDNFNRKYSGELRSKIKAKGLTEDQGVILASIVEREARSQKVRTEVASILLKRLKMDMGLNADATLQYALGYQSEEKSWWKRHLTNADKLIESPYNTYKYRGLPPAPICNPSLSSLQAVANADSKTPYLYYYHDSKGNSHYGKTLDEHNENVANNP